MNLRKPKRAFGTEINITPLIDIVFLLIIFSMVVSQFTKLELDEVDLPEAAEADDPEPVKPDRLIISMHRDGTYVVAGKIYAPDALERLIALTRENQRDAFSLLLRGDRRADWKDAAKLLKICAAQKIEKLKFAVLEEGASGAEP